MTVEYSADVATATCNYAFLKLLIRWKGSIYKLVWMNQILYMSCYFFLTYTYRYILDEGQQTVFEKLSIYCRKYVGVIPLSFILGFYVSIIMDRWWKQFTTIPWPDTVGIAVITSIKGTDDKSRLIRRTIMRYVNLGFVIAMQLICPPCKERFPTWDHMVEAGLMLDAEKVIFEHLAEKTDQPKYWVPLVWASNVAAQARKEKKVYDDISLNYLVKNICEFRTNLQILMCYDWVYVPIVYTQVVTLATYCYFMVSIMARQFLLPSEYVTNQSEAEVDLPFSVPIFLFLEFFFYFGWLNVAETLVNPFGGDDDDFDINYLIDRNLQISFIMVDDITSMLPEMALDQYWDEEFVDLPYHPEALKYHKEIFQGSAAGVEVKGKKAKFVVDQDDALKKAVSVLKVGGDQHSEYNPGRRATIQHPAPKGLKPAEPPLPIVTLVNAPNIAGSIPSADCGLALGSMI